MWPFSRKQAPIEAKSLASPSADLLEIFGAAPMLSGISVTTADAIQVPAVASAIKLISEAAGALDLTVKEIRPDGSEVTAAGHPVADLLRSDPNSWTGWPELIADLVSDALIHDLGGTAYVNRTGDGKVVEVIRYDRAYLQVELAPGSSEPSFAFSDRQLRTQDVIHVRPPLNRAPINLARKAIAISAVLERHAAALFSRGARPGGVLSFQRGMSEDAVKRAIAGWRQAHEGDDAGGRTAILHDGATFEPLAFSSTDAQFQEMRAFQVIEIARAFRVPPTMLFDLSRATWSNSEQMGREFLVFCLEPWLRIVEGALSRALFMDEDWGRFRIKLDRDDLTRGDLTARATAINSLIAARVLSPNEARSWIDLPPRDGGDEFANPNINPEQPVQSIATPATAAEGSGE